MVEENTDRVGSKRLIKLYLIGSLQNDQIIPMGNLIRSLGFNVFDDWHSPGPHADDFLRDDEKAKGRTFKQALEQSDAIDHIFNFDKKHLLTSHIAVLVMPAGKSAHLELGWFLGIAYLIDELEKIFKKLKMQKIFKKILKYFPLPRKGYILLDDPERWDIMYRFADGVFENYEQLREELLKVKQEFE